jgi:hypothetical protein
MNPIRMISKMVRDRKESFEAQVVVPRPPVPPQAGSPGVELQIGLASLYGLGLAREDEFPDD